MEMFLKTKKSAGVRVTPAVYRLITAGNAARGTQDWPDAARNYRDAVRIDPTLTHIWLQLGHAEKEQGRLDQAEAAYTQAAVSAPTRSEPHLHLGHIYKLRGDMAGAGRSYLRAARLNPADSNAVEELRHFIHSAPRFARPDMLALLRRELVGNSELAAIENFMQRDGQCAILFNVSALFAAVFGGRSFIEAGVTGHKTIAAALERLGDKAMLCAHVPGYAHWLPVTRAQFDKAVELGTKPVAMGKHEREAVLVDLNLPFLFSPALNMPTGVLLVDVDASVALVDHHMFVQAAQRDFGARYIAFGVDLPRDLLGQANLNLAETATVELIERTLAGDIPSAPPNIPKKARLNRFERIGNEGGGPAFRVGTAWLAPEPWGCWANKPGGEIEIALPEGVVDPQIYLLLRGLPHDGVQLELLLSDGRRIQGEIERRERKWFLIKDLHLEQNVARLRIAGERSQMITVGKGEEVLPATVGMVGFYICERADYAARSAILEAITLGDLAHLERQ